MIVLALLLQAGRAAPVTGAAAAPPTRFSILISDCQKAAAAAGQDVVVCGSDPAATQRLPYPDEVVPDHPVPSNPNLTPVGALAAEATPCASVQRGCQVGFGPPIMPIVAAGVKGVSNALAHGREARARRRDGDRRQAIDLAATAPTGRVEP